MSRSRLAARLPLAVVVLVGLLAAGAAMASLDPGDALVEPWRPSTSSAGEIRLGLDVTVCVPPDVGGHGRLPAETRVGAESSGAEVQRQRNQWFRCYSAVGSVQHRWMDPTTGRFLSADPLGYVDGPSAYAMALNSPANYGDPMGLNSGRSDGYRPSFSDRQAMADAARAKSARIEELRGRIDALRAEIALRRFLVSIPQDVDRREMLGDLLYSTDLSQDQITPIMDHLLGPAGTCGDAVGQMHCRIAQVEPYSKAMEFVVREISVGAILGVVGRAAFASRAAQLHPDEVLVREVLALRRMARANRGSIVHDRINLRAAVLGRLDELLATQSSRARGPVLSGIMHRPSGSIYFGQNPTPSVPLHSTMAGRLGSYPDDWQSIYSKAPPGTHSEFYALNDALIASGEAVPEMSDFLLYNVWSRGSRTGLPIPRCPHCEILTQGVEVFPPLSFKP